MEPISWDEAFLILKKWRDEHTAVWFGPVLDTTTGGPVSLDEKPYEMWASADRVLIKEVNEQSRTILLDNDPEPWDLSGGTFEYEDERESLFPVESRGGCPCTLLATFPDATPLIFGRHREFREAEVQ